MANFPGLILTGAGRNLQAKAQIGQRLEFTRVALGQGYAPAEPESLTALVDEQQSLSIQSFEVIGDGTSKIRAILTNEGLSQGFFVREIGVYARDPDTLEETLYSYSNSDAQSDYLPAAGGATVVEQIFDLVTVIGTAQDVTAVIDDYITIATKAEIEEIHPYILPEAGLTGQQLRKASNAEGDTEWFDPAEGVAINVHSISETRTAVGTQSVFNLRETRTSGLAVYVAGQRLTPAQWTALNATQVQLATAVADGTVVEFVNNEEVGTDSQARVSLIGPDLVYPDSSNTYTITDYDGFSTYTVATDVGTVSRAGETITLDIPLDAAEGSGNLTITRNGGSSTFQIAVGSQTVATPEVLNPADGETSAPLSPTLTTSAFLTYPNGADTHASTDWQVATDSALTSVVWESLADATNLETIEVPDGTLNLSTQYYLRARHYGSALGASSWSATVGFVTTDQRIVTPTIDSPSDGAVDVDAQPTLTTSAFATNPAGSDTHASTDWQVATDSGFMSVVWESLADAANLESAEVPKGVLSTSTTYYVRARHRGSSLAPSAWAVPVSFTTSAMFKVLYAATRYGTGTLLKIDPDTLEPVRNMDGTGRTWSDIGMTDGPAGYGGGQTAIVFGDNGYLYVVGGQTLAKFDSDCNYIASQLFSDLSSISSVTFGGGFVWATSHSTLKQIDPDNLTEVNTFTGLSAQGNYGCDYMAKTGTIVVGGNNTSSTDSMIVFDPSAGGQVGNTLSSPSGLGMPFYSANLDRVFLVRQYDGEFWGYGNVDATTGGFTSSSPWLNSAPTQYMYGGVFWSEAKNLGYAVSYYGEFWTINSGGGSLGNINPSDMGTGSKATCIDSEGFIFIACNLSSSNGAYNEDIVVYDGSTRVAQTTAGWLSGWSSEPAIQSGCLTINVSPTQLQSIPLGG